jgi:Holliday junction resolvase RusA-like endonuclease
MDYPATIAFSIPITPMSLQMAGKRLQIRNGKPIFFKTKKASDYQKIINLYSIKYKPQSPWDCAIRLEIDYFLERPMRLNTKKTPQCALPHTKRPDLDNIQKGTQDALRDFWIDDSQIADLAIRKYYVAVGQQPSIKIKISKLESINE